MSTRTNARAVGSCFLLAFVFYIAGGVMVDAGAGNPAVLSKVADHQTLIASGALLMMVNSLVIGAVGVLMFPILSRRHEVSAFGYLICRSVEAVMLTVGTVFLLLLIPLGNEYAASGQQGTDLPAMARVAQQANYYSYEVGMIAVGVSGLVLCRVLLLTGLVPRLLAVGGLFGYALFFLGSVLEVLGYAVGNALSVPGGLFEVALGVLLIAKGFSSRDGDESDRVAPHDVDPRSMANAIGV